MAYGPVPSDTRQRMWRIGRRVVSGTSGECRGSTSLPIRIILLEQSF